MGSTQKIPLTRSNIARFTWRVTFILMLKSCRWVVGGSVDLDYNVSSGPFLSFEIEIGDGPGPELDNNLYYKQNLIPEIIRTGNST